MPRHMINKADYVPAFTKFYLESLKKEKEGGAVCTLSRQEMAAALFGELWRNCADNQRQNLINHVNGLLDLLRVKVGEKKGLLTPDGKPTAELLAKMPGFKRTRVVEMITEEQVDAIVDQLFDDF